MSATREMFEQVVDDAMTLLQTANVNGRSWAEVKAMKPAACANTISIAVTDAEIGPNARRYARVCGSSGIKPEGGPASGGVPLCRQTARS